jgi:hypothetical protein
VVNFLAESIVASVTVITLGSLWLANSITKREHEAETEEELTREHWEKVNQDAVAWCDKISDVNSPAYRAAKDQWNASVKALLRLTREGK